MADLLLLAGAEKGNENQHISNELHAHTDE
jgi:hypothetical protein